MTTITSQNNVSVADKLADRFLDATTRQRGTDEDAVYEILEVITLSECAGISELRAQFENAVRAKFEKDNGSEKTKELLDNFKKTEVYRNFFCRVTEPPPGFENLTRGKTCDDPGIVMAITGDEMSYNSFSCEFNEAFSQYKATLFTGCGPILNNNPTYDTCQQLRKGGVTFESAADFITARYPDLAAKLWLKP